jgi:hypothetical protein
MLWQVWSAQCLKWVVVPRARVPTAHRVPVGRDPVRQHGALELLAWKIRRPEVHIASGEEHAPGGEGQNRGVGDAVKIRHEERHQRHRCAARCDALCAMPLSLSVPPNLWWSIFDQRNL